MDRTTIKNQARAVISARRKPILIASAIFVALALLLSFLSARLLLPPAERLQELSQRISARLLAGDADGVMKLYASVQPSNMESIVSKVLGYMQAILGFGFLMLLLRALHGEELSPFMLLDGFGSVIKILLLEILLNLILTFCFWALIIPGFIALYSYRMARYLLIVHPEYSVFDCLRESRLRMRGHRLELFRLDLSFFGWALLCLIPVLGLAVLVWLLPYWSCSSLLYYEALCASEPAPYRPENDGDRFF